MNKPDLLNLFKTISVWSRGDERAPHKPLLLLYALGRLINDSERLINFREVDKELKILLQEFGPSRKSYHTEYPFWRLQNDNIWQVEATDKDELKYRQEKPGKYHSDVLKSELIKCNAKGGFTAEVFAKLHNDPNLLKEIVLYLLGTCFPETVHEDILAAVGLTLINSSGTPSSKVKRSPAFRENILRVYGYACAVCGLNIRYSNNSSLCIEAAHIKWHQAGGPDSENNGLALCVLHHKLFDRGAFSISNEGNILVSQHIHGESGLQEWLLNHHGKAVTSPISPEYMPHNDFVHWHRKEVFKSPER